MITLGSIVAITKNINYSHAERYGTVVRIPTKLANSYDIEFSNKYVYSYLEEELLLMSNVYKYLYF